MGMFHHENHAAVQANGSIMMGMFVCCVFASQKPSKQQFFVPTKTDVAVKLLMFISYSNAQSVNELLCLSVFGCDGHTTNADHQRQKQWHIYIIYVPSHVLCTRIAMSVMSRATATEVR
jgi:hypothetical protein